MFRLVSLHFILYYIVSLLLILSLDNSVFTTKSGINDVYLFFCFVVVMFLCFRPQSYDSVAICLGSKVKDGVLLVEHLCLPGVHAAFISLKTKRHNLNTRSIIQRKEHNSGIISINFEQCQEHNMLVFRAQLTKAYSLLQG